MLRGPPEQTSVLQAHARRLDRKKTEKFATGNVACIRFRRSYRPNYLRQAGPGTQGLRADSKSPEFEAVDDNQVGAFGPS